MRAECCDGSASLTLELGGVRQVSRVKLWRTGYDARYVPRHATVQVRQLDNSWVTVGAVVDNTTNDHPEVAFAPVSTSAVRVNFTAARQGDPIVAVGEVTLQLDVGPSSLATQQFDAWGQLQAAVGAIATYGYTGREPDASGLVLYRARYYSPSLGRFVSRDPIGLAGGLNPYAYADGNPVNYVDPMGLTPVSPLQLPRTTSYPSYEVAQATQLRTMVPTDVGMLCTSCGAVGGGYQLNGAGDVVPAQRPPSVGARLWDILVQPSVDGLTTLLTTPGKAWENFQDNVFGGRIFSNGPDGGELKINEGQQGKHVPGHNNFQPGKSELTDRDPQGLVDKGAGTGQQVGSTPVGQAGSKERVDFGKNIGVYVDPVTGQRLPTSVGIIHHGSRGSHIVPARPKQ